MIIFGMIGGAEVPYLAVTFAVLILALVFIVLGGWLKGPIFAPARRKSSWPARNNEEGLSGPVFIWTEGDDAADFANKIAIGNAIHILSVYGPLEMYVKDIESTGVITASLENKEYTAEIYYDKDYMSPSMAEYIHGDSSCRGAWRLGGISPKNNDDRNLSDWRILNRNWVCDNTYLTDYDEDGIDFIVLWYYLFDGFNQPYQYYNGLDIDNPPIGMDFLANYPSFDTPAANQSEVLEEFEPGFAAGIPPGLVWAPSPEYQAVLDKTDYNSDSTPDTTRHEPETKYDTGGDDAAPAEAPEPSSSYEPASSPEPLPSYESPSYDSSSSHDSGSSYDSSSSYDSGSSYDSSSSYDSGSSCDSGGGSFDS